MNIEDAGDLNPFEPMPVEEVLYVSVIRYETTKSWVGGPSHPDKVALVRMLQGWTGVDAVRVYAVRVPAKRVEAV